MLELLAHFDQRNSLNREIEIGAERFPTARVSLGHTHHYGVLVNHCSIVHSHASESKIQENRHQPLDYESGASANQRVCRHSGAAKACPAQGEVKMNTLYYGDNLEILREHVKDETVDLVYLDPPFNSNASCNVLFKAPDGHESHAQIVIPGEARAFLRERFLPHETGEGDHASEARVSVFASEHGGGGGCGRQF